MEPAPSAPAAQYDPSCYLCPGNARSGGVRNPGYERTFVFDNDFPALLPETPALTAEQESLLVAQAERGICRVVCFSPDHSLTVSRMTVPDLRGVVDAWVDQFIELSGLPGINSVQIFENRGEMMGASNPHPHGQIWANSTLPNEVRKEAASQRDYYGSQGRCMLCDYLAIEKSDGRRIVCENAAFTALVPFWALWPFETLILPRRHVDMINGLDSSERDDLAEILKRITTRYDNLFSAPFPYTMGFHQGPTDGASHPGFHFHAHFFPPLLRSATIRKFMVGYEMLATPQRDITPESAAERLRASSEQHYLDR